MASQLLYCSIDDWVYYIWNSCSEDSVRFNQKPMRIYLDAMARNIHTMKVRHRKVAANVLVGGSNNRYGDFMDDRSWERVFSVDFEADDVIRAFKTEKKKQFPDENVLHHFRLTKRRMDLGWWDDADYKFIWNERRRY